MCKHHQNHTYMLRTLRVARSPNFTLSDISHFTNTQTCVRTHQNHPFCTTCANNIKTAHTCCAHLVWLAHQVSPQVIFYTTPTLKHLSKHTKNAVSAQNMQTPPKSHMHVAHTKRRTVTKFHRKWYFTLHQDSNMCKNTLETRFVQKMCKHHQNHTYMLRTLSVTRSPNFILSDISHVTIIQKTSVKSPQKRGSRRKCANNTKITHTCCAH